MIFSQAVALQQVQSLLQCYKELKVVTVEDSQIKLSGNIEINREWNDVRLNKDYSITIIIPIESNKYHMLLMQVIRLILRIHIVIKMEACVLKLIL